MSQFANCLFEWKLSFVWRFENSLTFYEFMKTWPFKLLNKVTAFWICVCLDDKSKNTLFSSKQNRPTQRSSLFNFSSTNFTSYSVLEPNIFQSWVQTFHCKRYSLSYCFRFLYYNRRGKMRRNIQHALILSSFRKHAH